jgi:hypothetical protein
MSNANGARLCIIILLVLAALPSFAQEAPEPHRFFDRQNIVLWSGVAIAHAMDCSSTWAMLDSGNGRESELPTSLAQSRVELPLFSIGVVGAQVGGSYLLHRMGWHRAERWVSSGHAAVVGLTAIHNYELRRQSTPALQPVQAR